MSTLKKKAAALWQPEVGIFLALWLLLLLGGRSRLFRDPGTFWHTRIGQAVFASGHLMHGDSFSFTMADTPAGAAWIPHQWLGECLMAAVHAANGWDGLLLATVTLLACLYTWVASRLIRAGLHWSLAVSVTAMALAAGSNHFHVRPHLATLVFFAMTCAFLQDLEAGRSRLLHLFWLVPVYALWTNLHGGMLGGLATLGFVWFGWTVSGRLGWSTPLADSRDEMRFGLLILVCALTCLVNPYGWRLPATWLEIMQAPHLTEMIQEHARLNPAHPEGMAVLALGAVYVALLASVRPWHVRATWLVPLLWFVLACSRVRHAPLFGLAAVLAVAEIFPQTFWAQAIVRRGGDLFVPPSTDARQSWGRTAFVVPAACLATAMLLQLDVIPSPLGQTPWVAFDPKLWPMPLVGTLEIRQAGAKVFNELNLGGFLIYYAPQLRVFIDDRCELYGDTFLQEYAHVSQQEPAEIERWRRQYGFQLALTLRGSVLDQYLRASKTQWKVVAEAEAATLFKYAGAPAD